MNNVSLRNKNSGIDPGSQSYTASPLRYGLNMVAVFTCANNFGFFRLTVNISLWLTKILKINYLGFKDKFKINLLIYDL